MWNFKKFRDFSTVLLICVLVQTPQVSAKGKLNFLSNGLGLALDVFGLGDTLRGLFEQDNSHILQDISDKLDTLQKTVDNILTYVQTFVEEVDIQNRFSSFDEIKRKIRIMGTHLNNILKADGAKRSENIETFLNSAKVNNYEVAKEIVSVMFAPTSGHTESLFEILVRRNRCSHRYIERLLTLVRNELELGISVEFMYLSLELNSTLTQAQEDWRERFRIIDNSIISVMSKCDGQMKGHLKEDLSNSSNITDMESRLTERYGNYELIGVIIHAEGQKLFTSNGANETWVHYSCIQSCDSGKMCAIYIKKDNNESAPTAVAKLIGRQDNFPEYFATDGWYMVQSYEDLDSEVDFYADSLRFDNHTQILKVNFTETVLTDGGASGQTTCAGPSLYNLGASLASLLATLLIGLMF